MKNGRKERGKTGKEDVTGGGTPPSFLASFMPAPNTLPLAILPVPSCGNALSFLPTSLPSYPLETRCTSSHSLILPSYGTAPSSLPPFLSSFLHTRSKHTVRLDILLLPSYGTALSFLLSSFPSHPLQAHCTTSSHSPRSFLRHCPVLSSFLNNSGRTRKRKAGARSV